MKILIIISPANSTAYARTRRAKMHVSAALRRVLLFISGLGFDFFAAYAEPQRGFRRRHTADPGKPARVL
jgi:hypothetical protein